MHERLNSPSGTTSIDSTPVLTHCTMDAYNHHTKRLTQNCLAGKKHVHCNKSMQGRTATAAIEILDNMIDSWSDEDDLASRNLSFEQSSFIRSNSDISIFDAFRASLNFMSSVLVQSPFVMSQVPMGAFVLAAKSIVKFAHHPTAFGVRSSQLYIKESQASLLAATVNSFGFHQAFIPGGIGSTCLVNNSKFIFRPKPLLLNARQSIKQLFLKTTTEV